MSTTMSWIVLIIAGLCETGFAFCLGKNEAGLRLCLVGLGHGLCRLCGGVPCCFLAKAAQVLPIGTAYPVWTGIGAVGTVLLGILFLSEPATFWRIFFITTLIASIVGLKMVSH